jgi:hypothetical protein
MTKPHRATPEQWESIERYADSSAPYSCFLELRARIEALEVTQQPQQDKMDRLIAIDRDDPANSPVEPIATDTFRALCAELTTALEFAWHGRRPKVVQELIDRARAALAQPVALELSPREVEAQDAFTQMRDVVLNLSDGLEVNEVLGIIDDHTPEWV